MPSARSSTWCSTRATRPTGGEQWVGSELCAEALRLGRMLAALTPRDTETLGLLALIELQASRLRARTGPAGEPILLEEQDRSRWDRLLIRRGLAGLERIEDLGGTTGPYALQAAIAACHARATRAVDTDWERITALYDGLARVMPSPVVELNRAVATGRAYGAEAGLAVLQPLLDDPQLRGYHLLPAVAGDLWCRAGQHPRARELFLQAAAMTGNGAERATMQFRAAACAAGHPPARGSGVARPEVSCRPEGTS